MKWLSFCLLALFIAAPRNDASYRGDGATVYTSKENRIRMVRETIQIRPCNAGYSRNWCALCDFEFENVSTEPVSILMGFPNSYNWGETDPRVPEFAIQDFTAAVDGLPVRTEQKPIRPDRRAGRWQTFDGAIVWPAQFAPRAHVRVQNAFSFGGFSSNGPTAALGLEESTYPNLRPSQRFWTVRKPAEDDLPFDNALVGRITYIMTTALTWKGPIGEAFISIELPPWLQENPHFAIPFPRGYRLEKDRLLWHFKDYSPKEEIVLCFIRALPPGDRGAVGFQYPDQAKAWTTFSDGSIIAPEVIDRLMANSPDPEVKRVLADARDRLQGGRGPSGGYSTDGRSEPNIQMEPTRRRLRDMMSLRRAAHLPR